ncbi:MAG: queuosine precursor transporter [Bacteroidales bacterium]|nr:queuosine precursor transporter [Bacteroidales bacterium]
MPNELLIIFSFILIYGSIVLFYRLFGKGGLLAFNVLATILANIEVLLLVRAFGIEMTLGNVLFASTFLITDILSENHGKQYANRAVVISTICSIVFILVSQMWLLYTPSENDWASSSFRTIFSSTPRIICASLGVYCVSQLVDVWLYHKWWDWCKKRFGDSRRGLWIRNNGSTLISQLLNTLLYTTFAFYGTYPISTLVSIFISSYAIFFVTSLLDTPFVYWCRMIHDKHEDNDVTD